MKINIVGVTYGELRTTANYSNKRFELTLGAITEPGESARMVKDKLFLIAQREVKKAFGDNVDQTEFDLPF